MDLLLPLTSKPTAQNAKEKSVCGTPVSLFKLIFHFEITVIIANASLFFSSKKIALLFKTIYSRKARELGRA